MYIRTQHTCTKRINIELQEPRLPFQIIIPEDKHNEAAPLAKVKQFLRTCSHRLRATWKPTFEGIHLKIVSDTVSRRDCKSRSSCSTESREPSKRDRCETRDESRGLFTPPAAIARFPSFRANRRYEQREKNERERERKESVSCFGIKLTARARLASARSAR